MNSSIPFVQSSQMARQVRLIIALLGSTALVACAEDAAADPADDVDAPQWSYAGNNGPENWGDLDPQWQTCGDGLQQSPIDIVNVEPASVVAELQAAYNATPAVVENNGHTIEVLYQSDNFLTIEGERYELQQFHFHSPSEHEVDGRTFEMEAHLVHQNEAGELAVLSILLEEGAENSFLSQFWGSMPTSEQEIELEGISLNVTELLPASLEFYSYSGSLTTPPCSEGVRWMVATTAQTVSPAQVDRFVEIIGDNARPIQAGNGREIERHEL